MVNSTRYPAGTWNEQQRTSGSAAEWKASVAEKATAICWSLPNRYTNKQGFNFNFTINSPVTGLRTLRFLKKLKPYLFHCSLPTGLYSSRLSLDIHLRYWPSFIILSHTHFAIIHHTLYRTIV